MAARGGAAPGSIYGQKRELKWAGVGSSDLPPGCGSLAENPTMVAIAVWILVN